METIRIIVGSTRENGRGRVLSKYLQDKGNEQNRFRYEILELRELNLPHYNEPGSPSSGRNYVHETTKQWSSIIDSSKGVILVTPEYNGSYTGALKDAIDYLYHEWVNKPIVIVSYGGRGGIYAGDKLEQLMNRFDATIVDRNVTVHKPSEAFHDGKLKEAYIQGSVTEMLSKLEDVINKKKD